MAHVGEQLINPVTGQRLVFRRTTHDTGGELLEVESYLPPGSIEPVEHLHPRQEEHFEVIAGEVRVRLAGQVRTLRAGDTLLIPPGTPHAMWNAGSTEAGFIWQTRPALKTETFFETVWGLARDGKVDDRGRPNLLQTAVLMREYADEFRLTKPPRPIQRLLFGLLAPIARRRGYRGRYPRYSRPA